MDNFKIIYKILRALEQAMDLEEFDPDLIFRRKPGYFREPTEGDPGNAV